MDEQAKTSRGFVSLVGAGPGHPGLITQLGAQRLAQADAVLYDYLANPALLAHARQEAVRILVGKRAGEPAMEQTEINALMVRLAGEGKFVVRLKGGDPIVFGRGTEEAQALKLAGVPFEIVPGVTAGLAGLAYAGIPATDRELASTLTFVTGHEDENKAEPSICWEGLARLDGTLVFYMAVRRLRWIAERLIAAGMDARTPACVIEWATTPRQRTMMATLATIADEAERAGAHPPGLVVVGRTVSRRETMRWFTEVSDDRHDGEDIARD